MKTRASRSACFRLLLFAVFFGAAATASRAQEFVTPPVGSTLRKEVLDVIRQPVEAHFGQAVVFKPDILRVSPRWTFFVGTALRRDGSRIDYTRSVEYRRNPREVRDGLAAGMLYGGVGALLRRTDSGWVVLEMVYDASDVFWFDWDKRFGVPKAMLRPPE